MVTLFLSKVSLCSPPFFPEILTSYRSTLNQKQILKGTWVMIKQELHEFAIELCVGGRHDVLFFVFHDVWCVCVCLAPSFFSP